MWYKKIRHKTFSYLAGDIEQACEKKDVGLIWISNKFLFTDRRKKWLTKIYTEQIDTALDLLNFSFSGFVDLLCEIWWGNSINLFSENFSKQALQFLDMSTRFLDRILTGLPAVHLDDLQRRYEFVHQADSFISQLGRLIRSKKHQYEWSKRPLYRLATIDRNLFWSLQVYLCEIARQLLSHWHLNGYDHTEYGYTDQHCPCVCGPKKADGHCNNHHAYKGIWQEMHAFRPRGQKMSLFEKGPSSKVRGNW